MKGTVSVTPVPLPPKRKGTNKMVPILRENRPLLTGYGLAHDVDHLDPDLAL